MNFKDQTVPANGAQAPRSAVKPVPTLLNGPDAMLWAADKLEAEAHQIGLLAKIYPLVNKIAGKEIEAVEGGKQKLAEIATLHSGVVDVDLQVAAMLAGAKAIRAAANETKLVEARAAAKGVGL